MILVRDLRTRSRQLIHRHGLAGAAILIIVAALISLAATSNDAAPASTASSAAVEYRLTVHVTEGAKSIQAVYYKDGSAMALGDDPMVDVAVVVVTVVSPVDGPAECRITVNDAVIDEARASNGGQALCVWVAGNGPVVAAQPGVLPGV